MTMTLYRTTDDSYKRQITTRLRALAATFAALAMVLGFNACGHKEPPHCTEADICRLAALDDSIAGRAPSARSLALQGMSGAADSTRYYEYCVRLAKYYLLSATPDSMGPLLDRTISYARRQPATPHTNAILATAYACRASRLHNFHQSPDSVSALYLRAYRLLMKSDDLSSAPRLCGNLADSYFFRDDLPEAAAWYRRALFLVDSLALPKSENVTLYLGLARIYMNLNDFATSRRYYEQTARHYASMQPSMQAYFLNDYGSYFYYSRDYRAALAKFRQLERMLTDRHMEANFDMALCRLNMADVCLNLGMTAEARHRLAQVEPYFSRMGDPTASYYINTIKIGLALRDGDTRAVARILASEHGATVPMYSMRHIRNGYLRDYYARTGDFRRAYAITTEDNRQTDSLQHNRSNMRAAEIMDRFTQDTLRLHHSLAMEQKNADIYRTEVMAGGLTLAVVILLLLLALWMLHSRKQRLRSSMDVMKLKLAIARNRINPHFVFNVLNNRIAGGSDSDELLELTRLIRTNLDMSCRTMVSLADELDFVKRYVEVERALLGPDFTFRVELSAICNGRVLEPEEYIHTVQVPSMFIQILVENAIVHGLKGYDGEKLLAVDVYRHPDRTIIRVVDTGRGFDIRAMGSKKGTGLSIITQTIAVMNEHNKQKMWFSIRSGVSDGHGCESWLMIPDEIKIM